LQEGKDGVYPRAPGIFDVRGVIGVWQHGEGAIAQAPRTRRRHFIGRAGERRSVTVAAAGFMLP
jgi:hypothetical protein